MANVDFKVQHLNHDGGVITEHRVVGGTLQWSYKVNDVGDISYEIPLYDDLGLAIGGENIFAPYKTDYILRMSVLNGSWRGIHGGIHTNVGLSPRSGTVKIAGKDWAHWLEQPMWFDFYSQQFDLGNLKDIVEHWAKGAADAEFDANGFYSNFALYAWASTEGATQESIIRRLLRNSHNSNRGDNRVIISPVFNQAEGWSSPFEYHVFVQDETNIIDHIKTVAQMGDPYGFDFYMDWDKRMYFFGPQKTIASAPDPIWVLTAENIVIDTVPDFEWTNNGPIGTYMIGLGPGSPALWRIKFDEETMDLYRQWIRLVRVGDLYQNSLTGVKHATLGLQYGYPHKDLNLSIYPDQVNINDPGDGFRNHIGDVIRFKWSFAPYHTINGYFWITEQTYRGDKAGNWVCDLGLQQLYGRPPRENLSWATQPE